MLQNRFVPHKFWAEAMFTMVPLLNRSPTMAVKQKTPKEAWSGIKSKVSNLKVFRSIAYTWVPDQKRTKLVLKSNKLMIIGYSDTHKAYRLVDTDTYKVSFNRDVVVDKEVGPFHTPSKFCITKQPRMVEDSGLKLQVAPPKGGQDFEHAESPRSVIAATNTSTDTSSPSHGGNTDLDEEDPKKRPKWW